MRLIDADVLKQHIDKLPALPDGNFAGNHSALKALINMQPTIQTVATDTNVGDTISRQATIDAVNNAFDRETLLTGFVRSIAVRAIRDMPSVQPEAKEGHWIRTDCGLDVECKCSVCGYKDFVEPHDTYWFKRNYCPNCGAKMTISTK
jgi:hypothetical protein